MVECQVTNIALLTRKDSQRVEVKCVLNTRKQKEMIPTRPTDPRNTSVTALPLCLGFSYHRQPLVKNIKWEVTELSKS